MRRKLSAAVIIIGIVVMLYPFLEQGFTRIGSKGYCLTGKVKQ